MVSVLRYIVPRRCVHIRDVDILQFVGLWAQRGVLWVTGSLARDSAAGHWRSEGQGFRMRLYKKKSKEARIT